MVFVSQRLDFECAYLSNVEDSTKLILNAHQYKIEVTVSGQSTNDKFVIEFSKLRQIIYSVVPDHYYLVDTTRSSRDEDAIEAAFINLGVYVRKCPYRICAENLCNDLAYRIQACLSDLCIDAVVEEVKLKETTNSIATWTRSK